MNKLPMKDRLKTIQGLMWNWTCCAPSQEPTFRALLDRLPSRTILEIGTHQGVSTGLLAEYADNVITVDVLPNPLRAQVWSALGVADRIEEHVHKSQHGRDTEILRGAAKADLAFIDGSHLMRDVVHDFNLVRSQCARMILHDYWENAEDWPDVKEFVTGLRNDPDGAYRVEIHKPFVYVEVVP